MENKYFVPDISDIRVGYEYERFDGDNWVKYNFDSDSPVFYDMEGWRFELKHDIEEGVIRVPYLTKEQIEAEGWETDPSWDNPIEFWKEDYVIKIYKEIGKNKEKQAIRIWHGVKDGQQLFMGECKDINTFRYICKLLNIG